VRQPESLTKRACRAASELALVLALALALRDASRRPRCVRERSPPRRPALGRRRVV